MGDRKSYRHNAEPLSENEQRALEFIKQYPGNAPTLWEIAIALQYTGTRMPARLIESLLAKGYLYRPFGENNAERRVRKNLAVRTEKERLEFLGSKIKPGQMVIWLNAENKLVKVDAPPGVQVLIRRAE